MKEQVFTNRKHYRMVIFLSLLAALLLEGFLTLASVRHGKGQTGFNLWPDRFLYSSGYEISSDSKRTEDSSSFGYFKQINSDPQMYFAETGQDTGMLKLTFAEPAEEEIQAQIYSTENGEVHFQTTFIQEGSMEAEIFLTSKHYGQMRIDLDGSFALDKIEAYPSVAWSQIRISQIFEQWNLGRFAGLWLFMAAVFFGILPSEKSAGRKKLHAAVPTGAQQRMVSFDLLRTMAACFAVAAHVVGPVLLEIAPNTRLWNMISAGNLFFLTCNPLFLMLSGALLVKEKQEPAVVFYRKRLGKIAVPLVLCYLLYMAVFWSGDLTVWEWVKKAAVTVFSGSSDIAPHFWLMYALIVIYLFVPILRKTVGRFGEEEGKRLFLAIALLLTFAAWIKSTGVGGSLWFNWILWLGIFVSGYLIRQPYMRRYDGFFCVLGLITAIISYQLMLYRDDYMGIVFNGSILIVGISWMLFVLALRLEKLLGFAAGILAFLGKHSFSVLLFHWLVLYGIVMPGFIPGLLSHGLFFRLAGTFAAVTVISLILSMVFDDWIHAGLEKFIHFFLPS